jgi:hypothetical protein
LRQLVDERVLRRRVGQIGQVRTANHVRDEGSKGVRVRKHDGRLLNRCLDVLEPGIGEPSGGRLRVGELPRLGPLREVGREPRLTPQHVGAVMDTREIPGAPTLRHQVPAWLQRIVKTPEETLVIEHPVKRRGAEHRIGLLPNGQCRCVGDE